MSRNSSGSYSPPAGQPAVSGTAISSTAHNALVSDLGAEMSDSLSRSGKGGMLAPTRGPDGTVAAPAFAFTAEPGSGLYRAAAGDVRLARLGVDVFRAVSGMVGAAVWGTLGAASAVLRGAVADGATAVGVVLDNSVTLATVTARLLSIRNNGVEKAYFDRDGYLSVPGLIGSPVARSNLPAVGQQVSASSALFSTASAALVDVTNLSVTITTTGRPVVLALQSDGSGSDSSLQVPNGQSAIVRILRDAAVVGDWMVSNQGTTFAHTSPGIVALNAPVAGTYTYKVQASVTGGGTFWVRRCVLVAYEL